MYPSSAPWLHVGVCWVGWGDGWAPRAAEESSSCMGTHGWTWYHHQSPLPPPALPKALTQQSSFHAVLSEPLSSFAIFHWLVSLQLSSSWARLQEIPYLPKLAAEWGCMGGEAPSCLSSHVCGWPSLAVAFTNPLCPPASYILALAAKRVPQLRSVTPRTGSISSKESICVCVCASAAWAYSRALTSRCGPGCCHGPICCQPLGRSSRSIVQGCTASTRVMLLVCTGGAALTKTQIALQAS